MRKVTGVQLHHHTHLDDAMRNLANAGSALNAAFKATGDSAIEREMRLLARTRTAVGDLRDEATARFQHLVDTDRPTFELARDGDIPYPDETQGSFTPRCRCYDRCVPCESTCEQAALDEGWVHTCAPCRAHTDC